MSSLCFSSTKQIVVTRPGFRGEQMLICASRPHTFKVTLEEVHVWKTVGERIGKENEVELGAGETITKWLFGDA